MSTDTVVRIMRTYFPGMEYTAVEPSRNMVVLTLNNAGDIDPRDVENSLWSKLPRFAGIRVEKRQGIEP